jgi:hypothetical protein
MLMTSINHLHAEGESTRSTFFQQKMSESTVVGCSYCRVQQRNRCTGTANKAVSLGHPHRGEYARGALWAGRRNDRGGWGMSVADVPYFRHSVGYWHSVPPPATTPFKSPKTTRSGEIGLVGYASGLEAIYRQKAAWNLLHICHNFC